MNPLLQRARTRLARPVALQGQPSTFSDVLYQILGIARPTTSLPATDANVRGLPAAWAAQNMIGNAVAQMMTTADVVAGDGLTDLPIPPVVDQPDVSLDSFTYWKMVAITAVTRGNFVGIKADVNVDGYPNQVIAVPPDSVTAYYDEDGFVVYEIGGEPYVPDELVHVRCGVTVPGQIMTIGFIEANRRALSGHLDQQGMANSVWKEGAVPSGVVQLDVDNPTVEQATTVKTNWIGNLGGRRGVAVTGRKQTYTPITWSADDAQFIESRQFSVAEMALMMGLQPSKLDATIGGQALTYGNRQDDNLQTIVEAYTPVMLPVEQAWSRLIPGKAFVRGNPEALLRSTTRERIELTVLAQSAGTDLKGRPLPAKPEPPAPPAIDPPEPPAPTGEDPTG